MIAEVIRLLKRLDEQRRGRIQAQAGKNEEGQLSLPAYRMFLPVSIQQHGRHSEQNCQHGKELGVPVKSSLRHKRKGPQRDAARTGKIDPDMKLLGILLQRKWIILRQFRSVCTLQIPLGNFRPIIPHFQNIFRIRSGILQPDRITAPV